MAFAAAVGLPLFLATRPVAVVVRGKVQYVSTPHLWFLWFFVGIGLFGFYAYLASYHDCLYMFGRKSAGDPDCFLSLLPEDAPNAYETVQTGGGSQETFKGITYLYVAVQNRGDTSRFSANSEIGGTIRLWCWVAHRYSHQIALDSTRPPE